MQLVDMADAVQMVAELVLQAQEIQAMAVAVVAEVNQVVLVAQVL
jgi:hypothetical protein